MTDEQDDEDAVFGDSFNTEEKTEHGVPETASAPPSGGVTPSPDATPRDIALEGLTDAEKHAVIVSATDIGVHSPQDATWILLRKIRDGVAAAQASSDAAARIEAATKGVAKTIFDQTHRAGEDLKGLVSSGIRETTLDIGKKIGNAIDIVTQRGAEKITSAASELDQSAHDKMAAMVQEYKGHLAKAARQEAERRSSFTGAVRWGIILSAIFGSLLFGAANGWFGYRYAHRRDLTPTGLQVFRQPGGGYILYFSPPPVAKLRFVPCRISGHICLQVTPVR
jgi:hypothetical protein